MKKLELLLLSAITLFMLTPTIAQKHADHYHSDNAHKTKPGAEHGKHKIALYGGFTHIAAAFYEHETDEQSTGKWVQTFGAEYYYTLSKKFDIGFVADIELDEYYIKTSNEEELERNNIFIAAAVLRYKPFKRLGIFIGPGYESEFIGQPKIESFFVAKMGFDYEVEIENGWEITPIFAFDAKEEYSSYSWGISIGKRF